MMCIINLVAAQQQAQQQQEQRYMLEAAKVYAKRASTLCPEVITAALRLDGGEAVKVLQTLALTLETLQELTERRYAHGND